MRSFINSDQTPINSVPIPTAQSTTLCGVVTSRCKGAEAGKSLELQLKNNYPAIYYIFLLQKKYGLRISEVLSISHKNITSEGNVLVKGSKGSNDHFVDIDDIKDFMLECRFQLRNPFTGISRFHVYRVYKKLGINIEYHYGTKQAVTHGFRYAKVKEISEIDNTLDTAQLVLGHKNQSSTKHYKKDGKI